MIRALLSPDKNAKITKLFHKTSYLMFPLLPVYFVDVNPERRTIVGTALAGLIGKHSYYSCSGVLGDYVPKVTKVPVVLSGMRFLNILIHLSAFAGIIKSNYYQDASQDL